jgi:hypothetical protein
MRADQVTICSSILLECVICVSRDVRPQLVWTSKFPLINEIGKVYSFEYDDISKVFFTPPHISPRYMNVILGSVSY